MAEPKAVDPKVTALRAQLVQYYNKGKAEEPRNPYCSFVEYAKAYVLATTFNKLYADDKTAINGLSGQTTAPIITILIGELEQKCSMLQTTLQPKISKLLSGPGGKDSPDSDIAFACQALKLPTGSDKLCDEWFSSIVGLESAKERLLEGFVYPLLYPNMFGKASSGVLLYGPPGTGKTSLAKAALNEMDFMSRLPAKEGEEPKRCARFLFFAPSPDMLKGKYVGETEQKIRDMFMGASKLACRAAEKHGGQVTAILFLDEVDGLAPRRDVEGAQASIVASSVNSLLQMIDGFNAPINIAILAATNFPQNLDSAFLRRFQYQIPVDLPTKDDALKLLNKLLTDHVTTYKSYDQAFDKRKKMCSDYDSVDSGETPEDCVARVQGQELTCDKPEDRPVNEWETTNIAGVIIKAKLMVGGKLCLDGIADKLAKDKYSGSDIVRYFQGIVKLGASRALSSGIFLRLPGNTGKMISINCCSEGDCLTYQTVLVGKPKGYYTITIEDEESKKVFTHSAYGQLKLPVPYGVEAMYVGQGPPESKVKYLLFQINTKVKFEGDDTEDFELFVRITQKIDEDEQSWVNKIFRLFRMDGGATNIKSLEKMFTSKNSLNDIFDLGNRDLEARYYIIKKSAGHAAVCTNDQFEQTFATGTLGGDFMAAAAPTYVGTRQFPIADWQTGSYSIGSLSEDDDTNGSKWTFAMARLMGYTARPPEDTQKSIPLVRKPHKEPERKGECCEWLAFNSKILNWDFAARMMTDAFSVVKSTHDKTQYAAFKKFETQS